MIPASLVLALLLHTARALLCYETGADGKIVETFNESWKYCSFVPPLDRGE